jgi:GNAT superfamily N-acetyltransferase
MRSPIQIRLADFSDVQVLFDIRRASIRQLSITHLSTLAAETWATQCGVLRIESAIKNDEVWIASRDLQTVGWIHRATNSIEGLYVSPPAARQGVGAALMRFAEYHIAQDGHDHVILKSSYNAMGFYLRLGYIADHVQTSEQATAMRRQLRHANLVPPRA